MIVSPFLVFLLRDNILINSILFASKYKGDGDSDTDYLAEKQAYLDCCSVGSLLTTDAICDSFTTLRPPCTATQFQNPTAGLYYKIESYIIIYLFD